ncbi:hypothetical protein N7495_007671, partial [Penicillium taxi]|uniref:uncharacterized protein n=1 Tax=Penicillium taxi TaxID=168475 RepID=UPI0025454D83
SVSLGGAIVNGDCIVYQDLDLLLASISSLYRKCRPTSGRTSIPQLRCNASSPKSWGARTKTAKSERMLALQGPQSEMRYSGEEKPMCINCQRQGGACDYSVRLNWGGRTKGTSVDDSPSSLPSGYMETIMFSDPIPTASSTKIHTPASDSTSDGFINFHSGELASSGPISPTTSAPIGYFDSRKPQLAPEGFISPSQVDFRISSNWVENSPLPSSTSSGPISQYSFGHSFHNTFPSDVDQAVGHQSLFEFSFHSNAVSQPVSFLRNSVDTPSHSSSQNSQMSDDHGLGFQIPAMAHRGGHPSFSNSGDITALVIGSHKTMKQRNLSSTTGYDGMKEVARYPPRAEPGAPSSDAKEGEKAARESSLAQSKWQTYLTRVTDNYGLDCGRSDRDLGLNNDHAAIDINSAMDMINSRGRSSHTSSPSQESTVQDSDYGGYYASPVPINLPRYLSPLPSSLLGNPINLMYFHHFLNHTSRMLVPHDCDKNPFISVLPSMATGDPNLLNLLLAYSASHRARYLGHPEPSNRIAHWVSDVFPALRMALEGAHKAITDSHLATAILLLSLKIVSPGTFETSITWQSHLKLARDLFVARSEHLAQPGNRVGAFLARWLGYIDTMGTLSCRQAGPPLLIYYSVMEACCSPENYDEFAVDCFSGMTPRTGLFLLRLGRLVQECDNQRFDELGNFRSEWCPSPDMIMEARSVLAEIESPSERAHVDPDHHQGVECQDMIGIEEAFLCSGLLHLHRRALGSSLDSFLVKEVLRRLIDVLVEMRLGASTLVCSLFPLFTAGCDTRDPSHQLKLLSRFLVLEKSGMKQIQNARQLMQHCWERNLTWIALAGGEFLG